MNVRSIQLVLLLISSSTNLMNAQTSNLVRMPLSLAVAAPLAVSPSGALVAFEGSGGIVVKEVVTNSIRCEIKRHGLNVIAIRFLTDELVFWSSVDNGCQIWDITKCEQTGTLNFPENVRANERQIRNITVSPDASTLLAVNSDGRVYEYKRNGSAYTFIGEAFSGRLSVDSNSVVSIPRLGGPMASGPRQRKLGRVEFLDGGRGLIGFEGSRSPCYFDATTGIEEKWFSNALGSIVFDAQRARFATWTKEKGSVRVFDKNNGAPGVGMRDAAPESQRAKYDEAREKIREITGIDILKPVTGITGKELHAPCARIVDAAFSPDGKCIVVIGPDCGMRAIDLESLIASNDLLRSSELSIVDGTRLLFDASGSHLFIVTGAVHRWDWAGKATDVRPLEASSRNGTTRAQVPTEQKGTLSSTATDPEDLKLVLPVGHAQPIQHAAVHPTGSHYLTVDPSVAILWDAGSKVPLQRFTLPGTQLFGAFTQDGGGIVLCNGTEVGVYSATTGKLLDAASVPSEELRLIQEAARVHYAARASEGVLSHLTTTRLPLRSVRGGPAGRMLLRTYRNAMPELFGNGEERPTAILKYPLWWSATTMAYENGGTISPDGNEVLVFSNDLMGNEWTDANRNYPVYIFSGHDGKLLDSLCGSLLKASDVRASPDGRSVLVSYANPIKALGFMEVDIDHGRTKAVTYDLSHLTEKETVPAWLVGSTAAVNPSRTRAVRCAEDGHALYLYALPDGDLLDSTKADLVGLQGRTMFGGRLVGGTFFWASDELVIGISSFGQVVRWNIRSKKTERSPGLPGLSVQAIGPQMKSGLLSAMSYTDGSPFFAVNEGSRAAYVFDKEVRNLVLTHPRAARMFPGDDDSFFLVAEDSIHYVTDVGKPEQRSIAWLAGKDSQILDMDLQDNGRSILMRANTEGVARCFLIDLVDRSKSRMLHAAMPVDPNSKKFKWLLANDGSLVIHGKGQVRVLPADTAAKVISAKVRGDVKAADMRYRRIFTVDDGIVRIYDLDTGKELTSLVRFATDDWLFLSPQGYYGGSRLAPALAVFEMKGEQYTFDQFDRFRNRPDTILDLLGSASRKTLKLARAAVRQRHGGHVSTLPGDLTSTPPTMQLEVMEHGMGSSNAKLKLTCTGGRGSARAFLWVNGVPLWGTKGTELMAEDGHVASKEIQLETLPGRNEVACACQDNAGVMSHKVRRLLKGSAPANPRTLHVLTIATNNNQQGWLPTLSFAEKDGDALRSHFNNASSTSGLFTKVVQHTFIGAQATKQNITSVRRLLEQTRPQDAVVMLVSGHGDIPEEPGNEFVLITNDIDSGDVHRTGLAYSELMGLLDGIPARERAVFIDACYSGIAAGPKMPRSDGETPSETDVRNNPRRAPVPQDDRAPVPATDALEALMDLFARTESQYGVDVITASSGDSEAKEGSAGSGIANGIFTFFVIKGLQGSADAAPFGNGDGSVVMSELKTFLRTEMPQRTKTSAEKKGLRPHIREENLAHDWTITRCTKP